MNRHEDIAKGLQARLSELKLRVADIDQELYRRLPADSEERAVDLENQETLEALEKTEV